MNEIAHDLLFMLILTHFSVCLLLHLDEKICVDMMSLYKVVCDI